MFKYTRKKNKKWIINIHNCKIIIDSILFFFLNTHLLLFLVILQREFLPTQKIHFTLNRWVN